MAHPIKWSDLAAKTQTFTHKNHLIIEDKDYVYSNKQPLKLYLWSEYANSGAQGSTSAKNVQTVILQSEVYFSSSDENLKEACTVFSEIPNDRIRHDFRAFRIDHELPLISNKECENITQLVFKTLGLPEKPLSIVPLEIAGWDRRNPVTIDCNYVNSKLHEPAASYVEDPNIEFVTEEDCSGYISPSSSSSTATPGFLNKMWGGVRSIFSSTNKPK